MALRAAVLSPGSDSRLGSSTEPRTTYLMSRAGIHRARSASGGVKMGKPSPVSTRASDSPSSRPPSRRCTDTLTRVPRLTLALSGIGVGLASPVGGGSPFVDGGVPTALMVRYPHAMVAPGPRHLLQATC